MSEENPAAENEWLPSVFDEWFEWQCDKEACETCRQFDRGLFEPFTEPEMPPEGCTCRNGCHCRYVSVPYPPKAKAIVIKVKARH